MHRLWRQLAIATNWPVLAAISVLALIGVVSIYADAPLDARKQVLFFAIGLGAMAAMQTVSYTFLGRYAWTFYFVSLGLLLYTVIGASHPVPGVKMKNGAFNWIDFGPFSLQPAELMKVAFCGVLARYLRFRTNYRSLPGLVPPFLVAMVPLVLILKQPDLGTALIFIPALLIMLFAAGAKLRHLAAVIGAGIFFAPIIWFAGSDIPVFRHMPLLVKNYQRDRVKALFSNDLDVLEKTGYQQQHALIAFGSGGWTGHGIGNIPVGRYVPESHNDMVFALIGEQFGFVGAFIVLAAYLVLFATGLEIAAATREPFGRLLAVGVVSLFAGQTFLNLMVCTRLMPVTGVTLPFVSYGGSSLLASFISAGLLLNIGQNRPLVLAQAAFEYD